MRQIKETTKQVRISKTNHKALKVAAVEKGKKMADFLNEVLEDFFSLK